MRKLQSVVWLTAALSFAAAREGAACSMCRCGDPTFALVGSQLFVPNTWHVGFDVDRFEKDQIGEEGGREREVDQRYTLGATYTAGRALTFAVRLPFSGRTITSSGERASLFGLSDPEAVAHLRLWSPRPGSWVSATLGARLGWGENDRQEDGTRAEEHLQPGTGSSGLDLGLAFSHVVGASDDGSVYGSVARRFNGRNSVDYHYGDAVLANVGYERRLGARINGIVEVNFRHARRDEPAIGALDPNTGGSVVYVSPRVLIRLQGQMFFRLGVQVPIVKSLYGDQDEKVNLLSGLALRF